MKNSFSRISLLIVMSCSFAISQAKDWFTLYDGENQKLSTFYVVTYNKHGAILQSSNAKKTIYLGRDCQVKSKFYGTGTWWWANAGWGVDFYNGKKLISGPRIDPPNIISDDFKCEL